MERNTSPLLSVSAAAGVLGVSRRTAYAMVSAHQIPATRVGGLIKVPAAALERWLADRTDEALASVQKEPAP